MDLGKKKTPGFCSKSRAPEHFCKGKGEIMNIPVTPFMWLMAFLPIIVLLILMLKFKWGATEAAPVGLMIAIVTGLCFYKADVRLLAAESAKGFWSALVILIIIWTAVLLYQVGNEANAYQVIRNGLKKFLPNELLLVLAIGYVFTSFLQGITGFGVPDAVGAPLLIGIGVNPLWAVVLPLFGESWGNTYGTLAAAWDALAMSAGLTQGTGAYLMTAFWTAAFIWFWNAVSGFAVCWFYGKGKAIKKGFPAILLLSAIQGGGELLLSQINTTLSCFVPACVSLIAILFLGRTRFYGEEWCVEDSPIMNRQHTEKENSQESTDMTLLQAFVPYILLSVITLAVLLIKPLNTVLNQVALGLPFPETVTGYGRVNAASDCYSPIRPFTHAGMFLFLSAVIGLIYYRKKGWIKKEGVKRVFVNAISMTMPSGISVIGLVMMSKVMDGTGQTIVLANGIASVLGKVYVLLAPFIGLLGTFMTGSNMSSNILFGGFQAATANLLNVDASVVLGAQSAGGAVGSTIAPSKIILGTTTANILGQEGEVIKKIMPITLTGTAIIGIIGYLLTII